MTEAETTSHIRTAGLVAIIRGHFTPHDVLAAGEALVRAGVTAVEVTLNSHKALDAISLLTQQLGDHVLIGAGTVIDPRQVDEAAAAGARYFIAPDLNSECIERARQHELPFIPGVFTATEISRALRHGCELLKLFPASEVRPQYLTAMRSGPFPQAQFMVTGGIGITEIQPYHRAGAVAFGIGTSLVKEGRKPEDIEQLARCMIDELKRVRAEFGDIAQ